MPHPNGNMKASGDLHLPDVESDLPVEEGHTGFEPLAHPRGQAGRPAARKAGLLTDPDLGAAPRLPHVTRGAPIAPGVDPLAGFQAQAGRAARTPRSLPLLGLGLGLGLGVAAGWVLVRMLRR